jgi:hypothetical protein
VLAEEIDASESLMMALYVSEDSLPSTNLMDTNSVAHQNAALLFLPKQIEVPRYTKRNPITAVFTDCNVVEDSSIISNYIAEVIEKSVYDHPVAKYPVSPPPPKPPDRSVQSMTMGFHSKWNHTMPRPPPHPPDANHRAEDSIIPFSCLERAVCTPPVWKNVSVNAHGDILALLCNCIMLRNLVGSKNIQRFMVEEGLVSMSILSLSCLEMVVCPPSVCENVCVNDCVFIQLLLFMLFQSLPPVRHHSEKDHEQVILVVHLSVSISLDYDYTMNVFEKSEVYGYGVVLFNVLISKHVDAKWQQALQQSHSHMLGFTQGDSNDEYKLREWVNLVVLASYTNRKKPCERKVVTKFEKAHTVLEH